MAEPDPFEIVLDSEEFRRICEELNRLELDPNAGWSFDGMSGSFKFSDEATRSLINHERLGLSSVTVLRFLFGYRISLVRGQPRADLAPWWVAARKLAPNWPGFLKARCSPEMTTVAEQCLERPARLSADLDALDESLRTKRT